MSLVYFMSDLHLDHKNICSFRPQFSSVEEHNEYILDRYRSVITRRDTVIFTGDVAFSKESLKIVSELEGHKVLVCGNHDRERGIKMGDLVEAYDSVHALWSKKGCWISHAPLHPDELRGKFNIHGHVHSRTLPDPRYYNVSMENIDYKPKKFMDILEELRDLNPDKQ